MCKYMLYSLLLLLGGCAAFPALQQEESSAGVADPAARPVQSEPESFRPPPAPAPATSALRSRPRIRELGTDHYLGASPGDTGQPDSAADEPNGLVLNFQDTDLREFVKAILGDVLKLNYLIDPQVSGKVTLETSNALPREQLYALLEEVLSLNGAAIIRRGELYEVLPRATAAAGRTTPTLASNDDPEGYIVRLVPLQYISATELQDILKPFAVAENQLRIDAERNLLILSGTRAEVALIEETAALFDVDWMKGRSIGMYPLNHVTPKDITRDLQAILGDAQGDTRPLKGLLRTVVLERLNSILLIATTSAALREAELWLYRLDQPGQQVGRRLYVYPIQNAKAVELAEILNQVFASVKEQQRKVSLAPGTTPVQIDAQSTPTDASAEPTAAPPPRAAAPGVALPVAASIEIIADDTRNALVILAEPQDYRMVETAIRKLDIVPLQVLIQASIIEVTLTDDLNFGVEWFFRNRLAGDRDGRLQLDLDDAVGVTLAVPSVSYSIINGADQVRLALSALAGETEVNVLSTPSLMVLDNQTAHINVGDEIPVPTRQSVSNLDPAAPTVNEIKFRKTGVTLSVTPRVNNSGLVTMEIKHSVSDAVRTVTSGLDAPTIQQRELESTIAVNSGETLVLGGLIRDRNEKQNSGIPGLRQLPLIGKLFSSNSQQNRRTELLVLITPRVSRNRADARNITEELKRQLRSIKNLQDDSF